MKKIQMPVSHWKETTRREILSDRIIACQKVSQFIFFESDINSAANWTMQKVITFQRLAKCRGFLSVEKGLK